MLRQHGPALTFKLLNGMTYLDAVVKEVMRLLPVTPGGTRKTTQAWTLEDGRVIPSGDAEIRDPDPDPDLEGLDVVPDPDPYL